MWNTNKLREYLIVCLEEEHLVPFPKLNERRIPFSGTVKYSIEEEMCCKCRMPSDNVSEMISCSSCCSLYHYDCIGIET